MKTYLVQLAVQVPDDIDSPEGWAWNKMLNPSSDPEDSDYTPAKLLSAVELNAETLPFPIQEAKTPEGPTYSPITGPIKAGEATFDGGKYDAVVQEGCKGCVFDPEASCDDRLCSKEDSPFGVSVIYVKQQKD